jgi:phage shock protein PspC (stress-responsive transcriptional regulator)
MKRTYTINIRGTIFHIEEDAYEVLQKYLVDLKNHFGKDEDGREILADIESRIAEIFIEKSPNSGNLISPEVVQQVIEIMGSPEDIADETDAGEDSTIETKRKRRFYRDSESRVFGGVCSGLGAYFNMDPVLLRIIFVVLFFVTTGAALFAYIILWIAVPKAETTAQRLEMRGEEATVKNIEKSIREEIKGVKESYNKFKSSETYAKSKKSLDNAGEVTYNGLRLFSKVLVKVVGIALIIGGFVGLLGLFFSVILGQTFIDGFSGINGPDIYIPDFLNYFIEPEAVTFGIINAGILAIIPLLAMLYIGSKLVFNYKSNSTAIGLSLMGVWLVALFSMAVLSLDQAGNFKNRSSIVTSNVVQADSCEVLYLKLAEDRYTDYLKTDLDINNFEILSYNGEEVIAGKPGLDIEKAGGESFIVAVRKVSRGHTREDAGRLAEEIIYNYTGQDSTLLFDPYFLLGESRMWRDQKVTVTVKVPEGKAVYLDENMDDILEDIENVSNTRNKEMTGKVWEMKPDGLTIKQ